ncbi:hypothetical protein [Treponema porcinum]|uniref:hypothetical protein n=1 Tax=Treponema porcinum TaxID=261392 RepID=UPI0023570EC6|nr:hypothetical protein [Treponema porcinum]MCI6482067.1 hypothetical protein [Treponema porcinum]
MKKILSVFAAAALLFGFASCSGDLHDQEPLQLPFIIGDMNGDGTDMTSVDGNVSTYTFTYNSNWNAWGNGGGKMAFKPLIVIDGWKTPGWGPATEDAILEVNGEAAIGVQGGGSKNFVATGLVNGKEYTITVTSINNDVSVALTGYVKPAPVEADLSAINATTMAQPNAYIEIKGDAWKNAIVGKYFFNKIGDNYVAVIPFDIPADATNGWNTDHLQAWGKIGVGDNDLVVAADRQFNYSSGELNFVEKDPNNIDIAEIVQNTKGIIKVTADADGCKLEAILY